MKSSDRTWSASKLGLALMIAGTGAVPTAAHADQGADDQASEAGGIADIVVTARRREEALQSVPVAISALSGADLERKNIVSLENLNAHVPALRITKFQGSDTLIVSIRGQRNSQAQPGQDPAIGVYFAEVPTGFQQGLGLGMYDLENVQVLKGPQGTLFGRNSTGGAILLSPTRPKDEVSASIRGGFQSFRGGTGFSTTSTVNLPIGDRIALRFALNTVNRDGWQKNIADPAAAAAAAELPASTGYTWIFGKQNLNKRLNDQDSYEWRVSLTARLTDDLENYLVYQGADFRSNGLRPRLTNVLPAAPLRAVYEPFAAKQAAADFWSTQNVWASPTKLTQHQVIDILTLNLGEITLKNIFGAKWLDRSNGIDATGTPASMGQGVVNDYFQKGDEISEEFQIQGRSLEGALDWTVGVFYFKNKFDQDSRGSGFGYTNRPASAKSSTLAGFAQATYKLPFLEGLSLTGGGRYTSDKRSMTKAQITGAPPSCRLRQSPTDPTVPVPCLLEGSATFKKWTYSASIDYQIDPRSLVYFSHSKGYRAGGYNISETFVSNYEQGYKPETVYNFEVGLKKDWDIGFPVRTNLAAYTQKFENVVRQAQNPTGPIGALLTNASQARLKGFEAEVSIKPFTGLDLGAAYGYVDAKYTAPFFPFANSTFNAQAFEFSLVPKSTLTLNATYTLPLDRSIGEISFGANYYRQSRMYWDDAQQGNSPGCIGGYCGELDQYSQKPYGVLDLRFDWRNVAGSRFDLALWATNVTKTKYNTSGVPLANTLAMVLYPGDPRFFGADVTYRFGGN